MKKIIFAIITLLSTIAFSQIKFEKGYYVTNSGQKIDCYIKNIDWMDNPKYFNYKINESDSETFEGSLKTVSEFGVEDKCKFVRVETNIELSSSNINQLQSNKNPIWVVETLFLKVLIEGSANLYSYNQSDLRKYFFKTDSNPKIVQLINIKYLTNDFNKQGVDNFENNIKTNDFFKNQLYSSLKCGNLNQVDFENLTYSKNSLIKIFESYNSCNGNSSVNFEKKNSSRKSFNLKITPSINFANLNISDPNSYNNLSTKIENKFLFKIGAEMEYILPFNNSKWSLFINPTFETFKAKNEYLKNDGFGPISEDLNHKVVVNYTVFEIPTGIRYYSFINKNSKLFYNLAYVFKLDSSSSNITFDDGENILKINSRNNFALGIGYCYKNKWSAEFRVNTPSQILGGYISWSGKYTTNGVVLAYNFL